MIWFDYFLGTCLILVIIALLVCFRRIDDLKWAVDNYRRAVYDKKEKVKR